MQMHQAAMRQQQDGAAGSDGGAAGGAPGAGGGAAVPNAASLMAALQGAAGSGVPGGPGAANAASGGAFGAGNPALTTMLQQAEEMMRQNPELVSQMMQSFMGAGGQGAANPLGAFDMGGAGFPPAAVDSRPPEER